MNDVLLHWLVIGMFAFVGIPWSKYLFGEMSSVMLGMSRPLGLALVGVGVWTLAMIGLLPFNGGGVLVVAMAVGYVGWRLCGGIGVEWLRHHWRRWLRSEFFFLIGFAMVLYIRGRNADPWGTERPMDYAFFNSMLNSPSFPPLDPWMSGFSINYYYAGYLLAALPASITAIDPATAYNLALATTAGMVAATAASVVDAAITSWDVTLPIRRLHQWLWPAMAVLAVLVLGNLGGFLQVASGLPEILALEPRDIGRAVVNGVGSRELFALSQPFRGWDFDGMTEIMPRDMWNDFNWWNPSRAVWDALPLGEGQFERRYAITEFPFFSYWLGDMHPHVMSLPFTLLLVGLALRRAHASTPDIVLPALLIGLLYPLNSWDYPTFLLLYMGAVVWQQVRAAQSWRIIAREVVLVTFLSYMIYLPFHTTFHSLVGDAPPLVDTPIISTLSQFFGLAPARTQLHGLFIMFGLFIVPILIAVAHLTKDTFERRMLLATVLVGAIGAVIGFVTLAAIPLTALLLHMAFRRSDVSPSMAIWFGAVALASILTLAVDVVYIRDTFSSRMNTVFKFYYQVWGLWGITAAIAGWYIWQHAAKFWRIGLLVCVLPLMGAAAVYPAATLGRSVVQGGDWSLAGRTPRDYANGGTASIDWLRTYAPDGSVIVEAVDGQYDMRGLGVGGISAATGLPTLMGWPGHQGQWRGGHPEANNQIGIREQAVRSIYESGDAGLVEGILREYRVRYIYVGNAERTLYGETGLAVFDIVAQEVFREGDVIIYEVNQ